MARSTALSLMPRRRSVSMNSMRCSLSSAGMSPFYWSMIFVRKSVPTFRDHALWKQPRKLGQERLIGEIEAQRRHRNAVVGKRCEVGAVLAGRPPAARVGDPEIRIAAAVVARVDVQQLLVALALVRHRDALDRAGRTIRKV